MATDAEQPASYKVDRLPAVTMQIKGLLERAQSLGILQEIREALLAIRIEQTYPKEKILELYLNEIYLGLGNYGIAAAALNYFDKSVNELSIAEVALETGFAHQSHLTRHMRKLTGCSPGEIVRSR